MSRDSQPTHEAEPVTPKNQGEIAKPTPKTQETETPKFEIPTELDLEAKNEMEAIIRICIEEEKKLRNGPLGKSCEGDIRGVEFELKRNIRPTEVELARAKAELAALTSEVGLFNLSGRPDYVRIRDKINNLEHRLNSDRRSYKKYQEVGVQIQDYSDTAEKNRKKLIAWKEKFGPTPE